jgi:putative transposase
MVTAGTLGRKALFHTPARLDLVLGLLFDHAEAAGLGLEAWAILRNHYHLVVNFAAARAGLTLSRWLAGFHAAIGRELNKLDGTAGRRVMHQYWDTELTFEKSWLARCTTCSTTRCITAPSLWLWSIHGALRDGSRRKPARHL